MNKNIRFTSQAANELEAAAIWYEEQAHGLGFEFIRIRAVDVAIATIKRSPMLYQIVLDDIRRCIIKKFPFGVFFSIEENCILIVSVFHSSRNPNKLKNLR